MESRRITDGIQIPSLHLSRDCLHSRWHSGRFPQSNPNIPLRARRCKQLCLQESALFLQLPLVPMGEAQGPVTNSIGLDSNFRHRWACWPWTSHRAFALRVSHLQNENNGRPHRWQIGKMNFSSINKNCSIVTITLCYDNFVPELNSHVLILSVSMGPEIYNLASSPAFAVVISGLLQYLLT